MVNRSYIGIQPNQRLAATWTLQFYVPASAAANTTVNGAITPYAGGTTYGPPSPPSGAPYSAGSGYAIPSTEADGLLYLYVNGAPAVDGLVNFVVNNQPQQFAIDLLASQRLQGSLGYKFTPPLVLEPTVQVYPTLTTLVANGTSAATITAFLSVGRLGV